jgi:hypothetical protein
MTLTDHKVTSLTKIDKDICKQSTSMSSYKKSDMADSDDDDDYDNNNEKKVRWMMIC